MFSSALSGSGIRLSSSLVSTRSLRMESLLTDSGCSLAVHGRIQMGLSSPVAHAVSRWGRYISTRPAFVCRYNLTMGED